MEKPLLSLCMIVRNEENNLPPFLERHKGFFNEWIFLDTGSTDKTEAIIKEHGLPVHRFEWCDNFAQARNASLKLCTGQWVLALDCDEFLTKETQNLLLEFLPHAQCDAIDFTIKNYVTEERLLQEHGGNLVEYHAPDGSYQAALNTKEDYGYKPTRLIRCFRNTGIYEWHSPIHEVVTSTGKNPHPRVIHVDEWVIHHLGMLAPKTSSQNKTEMYQRIAQSLWEKAQKSEDPKLLFEAGRMLDDPTQRLQCLKKALTLAPNDVGILKALANTYLAEGKTDEATQCCRDIAHQQPEEVEGYIALARCLALSRGTHTAIQELKSHMPRFRKNAIYHYTLATLHTEAKEYRDAFSYAQRAQKLAPESPSFNALAQKLSALIPCSK